MKFSTLLLCAATAATTVLAKRPIDLIRRGHTEFHPPDTQPVDFVKRGAVKRAEYLNSKTSSLSSSHPFFLLLTSQGNYVV